jgi:alanine dehydrogenase
MPGAVPHTSTYALTNVTLPYVVALAEHGWKKACQNDAALAKGLNVHAGSVISVPVGAAHGMAVTPVDQLLK